LRIGTWAEFPGGAGELHPECRRAVEDAARLLEDLGHVVESAHPPVLDRTDEQAGGFMGLIGAWVASSLRDWEKEIGEEIREDDVEPGTWGLAQIGRAQTAGEYVDHLKWLGRYTREMAAWWSGGFDVLVTPTLAVPPPEIGWLAGEPGDPGSGLARILSVIPYTPAYNLTGQPAISLPLHWTSDGLPVGVQLVAALGDEDLLIRLAANLEEARPWAGRRPPVCA
jgi:amidase